MSDLLTEIGFMLQRFDWQSLLDVLIVTGIFFLILSLVRGTQAAVLLRGIIVLIIGIAVLTELLELRAFSWLMKTSLQALLIALPVIFAPELRRALERVGRAGSYFAPSTAAFLIKHRVSPMVGAAQRLADQRHGALITVERGIRLDEYAETGVPLDAQLSAELLLQVFHPNTPLHDGAVIVRADRVIAASCVMPLSASGTLSPTAGRHMGLRHRAALGISEVSDALALVISEEDGAISVALNGRMIRRLDQARLRSILTAFYRPSVPRNIPGWLERIFTRMSQLGAERPSE
ncbi:MAG: diadenylate cyclase CdaA [Anaerolineales bacterium]|jgi:diadenylate cyclase